jgi:LuxR family maltose regulon positive regulatory protein
MQTPTPHPAFPLAKIQPPRQRAGQVERPHLQRALTAALREHRLTVLVAPAGYGKTAALAQQIHLLPEGCALAWISADEDDQLQRFLACLSTALEPHDLPWRVAPEALGTLALAERGLRDVAGEIVGALGSAAAERGLIVIDDVHRITDPRVFELLQAVLDRLPENWTLVIASRVDPPLTLPRWRVAGELAEFRQHELRFSHAEVAALLAQGGDTPEPGASLELLQRTDGWAAGLRLSLSARPGDGSGSRHAPTQHHLFDYLASEVLDDMPADLRHFLLRCSVLAELTQARCIHVARMPRTAQLLEEVERRGLFVVSLDAPELTLRLHDLFRDFLEDRLQRDHPDEVPQLLRRAAAFLITATVEASLAQRLVRRICLECREEIEPTDDMLGELQIKRQDIGDRKFFRGSGCSSCNNTGYKGRVGLFELMVVDDEIRNMIMRNDTADLIREKAQSKGMVLLRDAGINFIFQGLTTIEEVIRETIFES